MKTETSHHRIGLAFWVAVPLLIGASDDPSTRPANAVAATQPAATRTSRVLEPVKEGTTQPATQPVAQFGDGVLLTDLVGKLDHDKKGNADLIIELGGKKLRLGILPNSWLTRMEASAASDSQTRFRVTGRTTSYRGQNHILIENATLDSAQQ